MNRPETTAEMYKYMRTIGLQEGIDFFEIIMDNGWASSEEEVHEYLESLDIHPNSD